MRRAAVEALGQLPPEALQAHAAALVAKLEDSDGIVRQAARKALGQLPPEALQAHAGALVSTLESAFVSDEVLGSGCADPDATDPNESPFTRDCS